MVFLALGVATAAAYAGIQPFAYYKLVLQDRVAAVTGVSLSEREPQYPGTREFTGTYRTSIPVLEYEQVLTFKGDTLIVVDDCTGTVVYRYTANMESETEGVLDLVAIASQQPASVPLQYVPEADCLILYSQGRGKEGVTYCR